MRMLQFLSVSSKVYAIAMILLAVGAANYFYSQGSKFEVISVALLMLVHAVCQLVYSFYTSILLDMKEFEEHSTLDNDMLFEVGESEVVSVAGWAVAMAVVASFVELGLALMGMRYLGFIFQIDFSETGEVLAGLILAIGLIGGLSSAYYNVRTWNLKRVNTRKGV